MGLIYLKKTYDMEQASILWAKEEIKCSNIVKQYKKWLKLMMLQKKS